VIFLHGWGGDASAFLFAAKRVKCRATLVDFYGFGRSPEPDAPLTVPDYAAAVLDVMDKEGIKSAVMVGHSFGGRVALELAAKYPERIELLVLVDSAGLRPRRGLRYYLKVFTHKILKRFGKGLSGSADYRALSPLMKRTFINVVNYNQAYLLKKIKAETAIIWGTHDKVTPWYMAKKFKRKISGSYLFPLTNAGHFSYLDNSAAFVKILSALVGG
jgi:Predicted hydrolases or acyltransferases (alpha/beta hydrolase superfamily)